MRTILIFLLACLNGSAAQTATEWAVAAWDYAGKQEVPLAAQSAVAIAAGDPILALKSDGSVIAWGPNYSGGTNIPPAARNGVIAVAAGSGHGLVLKTNGSVVAWGRNGDSVLNFTGQANVPVAAQSGVTAIAAGGYHSVALKSDGSVIVWGDNRQGQAKVPNAAKSGVVAIAAGHEHTVALKSNGSVVAWGSNLDDYDGRYAGQADVPLAAQSGVIAIAAGGLNTAVLKNDGSVLVWGGDRWGQTNIPIAAQSGVIAIQVGWGKILALKKDGALVVWGYSSYVPADLPPVVATAGASGSLTLALVTPSPPVIDAPPSSQAVELGHLATFTARASGYPLNYEWFKNGFNIPEATGATYIFNITNTNQAGEYIVRIHNFLGSTTSTPAALTVTAFPPVITVQPASRTIEGGKAISFSVGATGSVLGYQWRKDGQDIAGATNASHTLDLVEPIHAGNYTVVVSNLLGITTSAPPARLTVTIIPPVILRGPSGQTITAGENASFSVNATGNLLRYQWRRNGVDIPGAVGRVCSLGLGRPDQAGEYTVVVSNSLGSVTSAPPALLTVRPLSSGVWQKPAGTVVSWGTQEIPYIPPGTSFTNIAAAGRKTFAVKSDGTIVGWGNFLYNGPWYGNQRERVIEELTNVQAIAPGGNHNLALLSDGTVVSSGTGVPAGLAGVNAIAAGYNYNLALKSDGTVVAWGESWAGTAWPGASMPARLTNIVAISAGPFNWLALKSDGTVAAWGDSVPEGLRDVVAIAAGANYSLAVKSDGSVVGWGANVVQRAIPDGVTGVIAIATGEQHTLALKADGTVVAWGAPGASAEVPPGLNRVIKIAVGAYQSLALKEDGTLVLWGRDKKQDQEGDRYGIRTPLPGELTNIVALATEGGWYDIQGEILIEKTLALRADGTVVSWGKNQSFANATVQDGLTNVVALAAGRSHSLALRADGTVEAWGGVFNSASVWETARVPLGLSNVVAISAGCNISLALKSDGTVAATGSLFNGAEFEPATVPEGWTNVVAIAASGLVNFGNSSSSLCLALKSDGTVVTWGYFRSGGGDLIKATTPAGLKNVVAIAAGPGHYLALKADGTVVAWGNDGASAELAGLSEVVAIAAGGLHNVALKADGTMVCWGDNYWGQSSVPNGLSGAVGIAAGASRSLALLPDRIQNVTPGLRAQQNGNNVVISWPVWARDHRLQSRDNLAAVADWEDLITPPVLIGNEFILVIPAKSQAFFRLVKP